MGNRTYCSVCQQDVTDMRFCDCKITGFKFCGLVLICMVIADFFYERVGSQTIGNVFQFSAIIFALIAIGFFFTKKGEIIKENSDGTVTVRYEKKVY